MTRIIIYFDKLTGLGSEINMSECGCVQATTPTPTPTPEITSTPETPAP